MKKVGLISIILILAAAVIILPACSGGTTGGNPATATGSAPAVTTTNHNLQWSQPPAMTIDKTKTYFAEVNTTLGSFKIQLFANESPVTVNNFVFLAQQGFYNGIIFHRVIKTFMIQTGDPTGTGSGGPGYYIKDELPPKHPYEPGIVAMAKTNQPNTNSSQFFICTGPDAAGLSPQYTEFGKVVGGMDVVQAIASVPVGPGNPNELSRPVNPPVINGITITVQ